MNPAKLRGIAGAVSLAVLVVLPVAISHAQDPRNFWLLNNTGKTIREFYVSPHDSSRWGNDTLGRSAVPDGIGALIVFQGSRGSCNMDFLLVFADGSKHTYGQGRNVCELGAVQFNRNDSIGLTLPDSR
ncbi:MAG: hypothetical protein JST11_02220 [Acidobacteria bacterium]|nr:hypothetical protein [Acidobacteriota bacterium]